MTERSQARSRQKTLDQRRADQAWRDVQEVQQKEEGFRKKYGSLARKAPMLVLTNGLGQTLAFLRSKAKRHEPEGKRSLEAKAHDLLYIQTSRWVLRQLERSQDPAQAQDRDGDLLEWVLRSDSAGYRRATTEALAYLSWLKRFAEAELPTGEE